MHLISPLSQTVAIPRTRDGMTRALAWLCGALIAACAMIGTAPRAAAQVPGSFADLAESVLPAVVNITVTKTVEAPAGIEDFLRRFDPRRGEEGAAPTPPRRRATGGGTGFVIESSGIVITNNHVIEEAEDITVRLQSGEEFKAELIGKDPPTDLAVLRIKADRKLPSLRFGNSDEARIGDWVLTVGSPFGLGGSVTAGILSARNRDINTGLYDDFLQTDAPINPGNSGGPMINMKGEVIGINTAIFSPSGGNAGVGFAIPSNLAQSVIAQLQKSGKVQRGWLGVSFQPITRELADSLGLDKVEGVLVASVVAGGPADKGGIQSGDIILDYNGQRITPTNRLPALVAETEIGKTVKVVVMRKNKRQTLNVKIAERDESQVEASFGPGGSPDSGAEVTILGMTLGELTPEVRGSLGISEEVQGAVVLFVEQGSPAQSQGLRRGDVIVAVSLEDVKGPAEVAKRVDEVRKSKRPSVLLRVHRGGEFTHITVPFN